MKIFLTALMIASFAGTCFAQVLPGQAGIYTGTYKTRTVTTDSSLNDTTKMPVVCTIADDGSTLITSVDGLAISGNLISGPKLGFFSMGNSFVTGTGIWQMKKKGKIKAILQYGVYPSGDVIFMVSGQLKLKRVQSK